MTTMTARREELQKQAGIIKAVETRIFDLEKDLKTEYRISVKTLMQHSLRVNREVLKQLKELFWRDEL